MSQTDLCFLVCIIFGNGGNMDTGGETLAMMQALESAASSINVRNVESMISRFFYMNVPFQVTLECCSGPNPDDYVNVVTLSAGKAILYQESAAAKNWLYGKAVQHFHDFFEFVIVLEGSITQQIEGREYLYTAGSCCLLNRSLCHLERYHTKSKVLFIGLSIDFIAELFASAQRSPFVDERAIYGSEIFRFVSFDLRNPGKKAYLDFIPSYAGGGAMHRAYLSGLAEELIHTLMFPDFGASYHVCGMLCTFLAFLSSPQQYHCTNMRLDTNSDFLIFSRISHLFEESSGRMTRGELERRLNYSGDYLNRIVNKYAGMCLYDYGMTFCLKKAAKYLEETDEPISAIAVRLQFSNRTHFYTLFKAEYGMTPKEYRKRFKKFI